MSSMSGLYTGVSGLLASQAALNTTAHNLANVDNRGFVRQNIVISDTRYVNLGLTHFNTLQKGLGASIMSVRQVREIFLDQAYRREIGRQSFYEAQYEATREIENLFGELEGVPFQDTIEDFWRSLQEIAKEPDNIAVRSSFIATSVTFVERAEKIAKQLDEYQVSLNRKVIDYVDQINGFAEAISDLNKKITRYESSGVERANDLRDQRNILLDELGKIVNISYREIPNGTVEVSIEGMQFVTEDSIYRMGLNKISPDSPMLIPTWGDNGNMPVYDLDKIPTSALNTDIGALQGLLYARGRKVTNYTDIPLKEDYIDGSGNFDEASYEEAVKKYNTEIEPSIIAATRAKFDQLVHGIVTKINDILSPNKEITLSNGDKIWVLDEDKAPRGMDPSSTQGEALFNRKSVDRYTEKTVEIIDEDGNPKDIVVRAYNQEDKDNLYSLFTLGEIEVNPNIMNNYSILPLSSNTGSKELDMKIAHELISKWHEPFATLSPNTATKHNINDYYGAFIVDIGNKGQQFRGTSEKQAIMVKDIDNQRLTVTGVSSDEELTSLIKYQHAYNASARYVNVVSEMLEHIIMRLMY